MLLNINLDLLFFITELQHVLLEVQKEFLNNK